MRRSAATTGIRVGTRGSRLAVVQAEKVVELLRKVSGESFELVKIRSEGDIDGQTPLHNMAGRGVFASEVQAALLNGEVDVAVHSLKDMPLQVPEEAPITAMPPRGSPADIAVLLDEAHDPSVDPPIRRGSRIGTSSPRRQSQLLALDRDIVPIDLRGNVETRLRKLRGGWADGLVLAEAAIERLPRSLFYGLMLSKLALDAFPTCPGQGAVAVQTLAKGEVAEIARTLDDEKTRVAVDSERRLLALLGGGCGMPLGATVRSEGRTWRIDATLAREEWRGEEPPELATHHLVTKDLDIAIAETLEKLTTRRKAKISPSRSQKLRMLLVVDDATSHRYRTALGPRGVEVESWYPFEYESATEFEMQDGLIAAWESCSWVVLTSRRAVGALETLTRKAPRKGPWVAAVGPATASGLRLKALPIHFVSKGGTAIALATELAAIARKGDEFLYLSAKEAGDDLSEGLKRKGLKVDQHVVYARTMPARTRRPRKANYAAAVAFSPKGAEAALAALGKGVAKEWVAIGPTTAQALEANGVKNVKVARRRTPSGVTEALGW